MKKARKDRLGRIGTDLENLGGALVYRVQLQVHEPARDHDLAGENPYRPGAEAKEE